MRQGRVGEAGSEREKKIPTATVCYAVLYILCYAVLRRATLRYAVPRACCAVLPRRAAAPCRAGLRGVVRCSAALRGAASGATPC